MKDIKVRGEKIDTGKWVYGSGVSKNIYAVGIVDNRAWIFVPPANNMPLIANRGWNEVIPKTVGRFIGQNDKNEVDIYEGDIVEYIGGKIERGVAEVKSIFDTSNLAFWWIKQSGSSPSLYTHCDYFGCAKELEVIGNIHFNPELLKLITTGNQSGQKESNKMIVPQICSCGKKYGEKEVKGDLQGRKQADGLCPKCKDNIKKDIQDEKEVIK